jgi:hypothetical protein
MKSNLSLSKLSELTMLKTILQLKKDLLLLLLLLTMTMTGQKKIIGCLFKNSILKKLFFKKKKFPVFRTYNEIKRVLMV